MALAERLKYYAELETHTGNPLLVYVTSRRPNASGIIGADAADEMIRQIEAIEGKRETVDVLIESNGGDPLVVWRMISALRTKSIKVRALVPHAAFSAATLFCLGAEEIVVGKYACLGPIDPQITAKGKDGQQKNFAFEDILAFVKFVKSKFSLTRAVKSQIYGHLFESVEPFSLGFASRSSALSFSLGVKLLLSHSDNKYSFWRARRVSRKLNKNFFNHGHPLNKEELRQIGLRVVNSDEKTEELMWKIHSDLEKDFLVGTPFDFISNYLQYNPPLALGVQQVPFGTYEFDVKFAVMESLRFAEEYFVKYKTSIFRAQNLAYNQATTILNQGWRMQKP